ncbi:MAG: CHASE domain-containing protein [Acidimicrobiia bacterium]|nr:CHASE domain-containing protein [Acidimicrobiia bacterium]
MKCRSLQSFFSARHFVNAAHGRTAARLVLALAVFLGAASWYISHKALEDSINQRFEFRTDEVTTAIEERMATYEQVLAGGVALFNASPTVDRDQWRTFVGSLELQQNWPGIQGMGFAVPVEPDEVSAHEATIRAEGFPDYRINPVEPERDEYTAVVYLEPFDQRNQQSFGFDMWSNDVRREAMARARDTGEPASSGLVTLVQETDEDVQRGFRTYLPVYKGGETPPTVEQRREEFVGWVYAPFRMGDLIGEVVGARSDLNFEIYDDGVLTADKLLYDTDDESTLEGGDQSDLRRQTPVTHAGHDWLIVFTATEELTADLNENQPTLIAIVAILIDVLLFFVIRTLTSLERRATQIAEGITGDLTAAKATLERRSAELEHYTRELERSNHELAQFAHVAAHDLQEPLRTIGNYSQLVVGRYGDQLDDDGKRWLQFMSDGAQRMSNLIRSLLQYSSVEGDQAPFRPVDLDQAVDRALQELARVVEETGARIERSPLPTVMGDENQLVRLMQNLIANAIKYRSDEPPIITISGAEVGAHCRVAVIDNGVGIKQEYHQRIFELFRRVGTATDPAGTGLGLAICRRIVERHGGSIGVDSTPGIGSTFHITLPRQATVAAGNGTVDRPSTIRGATNRDLADGSRTGGGNGGSNGATNNGAGTNPARPMEKVLSHDS